MLELRIVPVSKLKPFQGKGAVCRFNSPTRKRGTGVIHSLTRRVVISTLISRTTLNHQPDKLVGV